MIPVITLPGSKSITNRALVCAALARGVSRITGASDSGDTDLLANGLNQLGVLARRSGEDLVVEGTGGKLYGPKVPIPVGNAGTTTRFLSLLSVCAEGRVVLRMDPRMAERPMDELVEVLAFAGAAAELHAPAGLFTITPGGGRAGEFRVRSDRSSQFLSALLLVAPYLGVPVRIAVAGALVSAPYVRMTLDVMRGFGVEVGTEEGLFVVSPDVRYRPSSVAVEADASSATYFLAAALIAGTTIDIAALGAGGRQPDTGFVEVVERMGAGITRLSAGTRVAGGGAIAGVDVDMNAMPDAVPALAVAALFASGPTRIRNVAHLRHKESDRLETFADELGRTGAQVRVEPDGLTITPGPLRAAALDPHGDHRLAMSFALLTLRVPGVTIGSPECVRKSFPRFWDEFRKLQGA
jgi:3-phosphoshikimate 1-carboxyvinyltransferase